MPLWKKSPLLRMMLPYVMGLIFSENIFLSYSAILGLLFFLTLFSALYFFLPVHLKFKFSKISGIGIVANCFVFGLFMYRNNLPHTTQNWYGHFLKPQALLEVTIASSPEQKTKTIRYVAHVSAIVDGQQKHLVNGKILIYFLRTEKACNFRYGDTLVVLNQLQPVPSSKNPGEFDYQRYLQRQQICHQLFIGNTTYVVMRNQARPFFAHILSWKDAVINGLSKYLKGDEERGIAEALLIGYKENLDPQLTKAYTNTGVVHIIAISGLHLGLIYMVLVWLVDLLPFLKRINWFKAFIVITSLWIFALMTGGSASVLRSAVMFTFIAIGKLLGRDSSMTNSLVASAMILLCYDPFLLWDVGFQLSYLAIIGIATLHQPLYNIFSSLPFFADKIWSMTSITIAAQVFTFPICIYYFQQFPNYFLLSNVIAVPLSTLILFQELLLLSFSSCDNVGNIVGNMVEYSIHVLNNYIRFINDLPFALTDNIPADFWIVSALYIFLTAVVFFLIHKNKKQFYLGLVGIFLLCISISACMFRLHNRSVLIVYCLKNNFAMEWVNGSSSISYADSAVVSNEIIMNKTIVPVRKKHSFPNSNFTTVTAGLKFISCNNKRLLLVHGLPKFDASTQKLNVDVLIVTRASLLNLQIILNKVSAKTIVIAAFHSRNEQKKCKTYATMHSLNYFDVQENGAFYCNVLSD